VKRVTNVETITGGLSDRGVNDRAPRERPWRRRRNETLERTLANGRVGDGPEESAQLRRWRSEACGIVDVQAGTPSPLRSVDLLADSSPERRKAGVAAHCRRIDANAKFTMQAGEKSTRPAGSSHQSSRDTKRTFVCPTCELAETTSTRSGGCCQAQVGG
jgi:hypothetical protein